MPASVTSPTKPKAVESIFITKGIAILMVVWVHAFFTYSTPFWLYIVGAMEKLPMPIFFFLSGYLLAYHNDISKADNLGSVLAHKAKRLAYPFVTMAVISLALKVAVSSVVSLEHPVSAEKLINLLLDPENSFVPLLWFMYGLMMMVIMLPLALRILKSPTYVLLFSLACYFLPWPHIFSLKLVFHHFPFFVVGYIAGTKVNLDTHDYGRFKYLIPAFLSMVGMLFLWAVNENPMVNKLLILIVGFLSILTFQILSKMVMTEGISRILYPLGYYSMSIYLLHTLFASPIYIIYTQILKAPVQTIPLGRIGSLIVGLLGPLLLEKYVLRKYSITRKLVLGIMPRRSPVSTELKTAPVPQRSE